MRDVVELVRDLLRERYGDRMQESADAPVFHVPGGGRDIRVRVAPVGEQHAIVDVYTWVGEGVEVTPDVARYLLEKNAAVRVGKAGLDQDGDILVEDALFPEQLNVEVLARTVEWVASTAREIEKELRTRR